MFTLCTLPMYAPLKDCPLGYQYLLQLGVQRILPSPAMGCWNPSSQKYFPALSMSTNDHCCLHASYPHCQISHRHNHNEGEQAAWDTAADEVLHLQIPLARWIFFHNGSCSGNP